MRAPADSPATVRPLTAHGRSIRPGCAQRGWHEFTVPISRRASALFALLLAMMIGVMAPASAADPRSPTGSWSAETPTVIDGALLATLEIREPGADSAYDRDAFGPAWKDVDGNGCDTRNDMLKRDLSRDTFDDDDCTVLTGTLKDPYTGEIIEFVRAMGGSQIDIDHMIPLSAAWHAGASEWTDAERLAYANDPLVLLAVDAGANRSKSDQTIAEWMPTNEAVACKYGASWVLVAAEYDLSISPEDHETLKELAAECG